MRIDEGTAPWFAVASALYCSSLVVAIGHSLHIHRVAEWKDRMQHPVKIIAGLSGVMVAVYLLDLLLGGTLKDSGVHPREVGSLYAILIMPFIHGDLGHLASNLGVFVVLAALCLMNGSRYFWIGSGIIIVLGGALVWLFGRDGSHIGASGWIFGLWALIMAHAFYDRSPRNIAIAVGVALIYGSMIWGILPSGGRVSFEGHLFGAIAGIAASWVLVRKRPNATTSITVPARDDGPKFWS